MDHAGLFTLSEGTAQVTPERPDRLPYVPYAFKPRPPWRPPTRSEESALLSDDPDADPSETIGVLELPAHLLSPLYEDHLAGICRTRDLHRIEKDPAYRRAVAPLRQHLSRFSSRPNDLLWHQLCGAAPGLDTITPLPEPRLQLIGLHVDHNDRIPIGQLGTARNRICVNLGRQARHFLFVAATMRELCDRLYERRPELRGRYENELNKRPVIEAFFREFPEFPVIRLRIRPGEAYVAPTENIIHDGSTEGSTSLDVQLTVRGWFSLGPVDRADRARLGRP